MSGKAVGPALTTTMMERRRGIKSFVRRQGRLTPGQERALATLWPVFGLSSAEGELNLPAVFGNDNPVHLEIGFGMGESLAVQAQQNPDINYLGVEVHRPGIGHLLMLLREQSLDRVRVFAEDSVDVLNHAIPEHSLNRVQVFFPDPWPKKRHHKRRLIQRSFVELLATKLMSGGLIHVATDWSPYAREVETLFRSLPNFTAVAAPQRPETRFERRGLRLGHNISDLAYRLIDQ